MNEIVSRKILAKNPETIQIKINAPKIAKNALPGQFVILRVENNGERIPLTIAESQQENGNITLIFQAIGATTIKLAQLNEGQCILDLVGPLGKPSELDLYKGQNVAVIGGGLGCAIAYPQALYLHNHDAIVEVIAGFRSSDIVILKDEMSRSCHEYFLCTDDGSAGVRGFVTTVLDERIKAGKCYDLVIAIGPIAMMKMVSQTTQKYGIKTVISLNPIMIDGTGMCGCCRVSINGQTKFACIDGPDFDANGVDFDELIRRNNIYKMSEAKAREAACNLLKNSDKNL